MRSAVLRFLLASTLFLVFGNAFAQKSETPNTPQTHVTSSAVGSLVKSAEVAGIIATFVGLGLTIWAMIGSNKVLGNLKSIESKMLLQGSAIEQQASNLNKMQTAMSTHHLADFPAYLPSLTKLVEDAHGELRIMCNFYGHGSFTAPIEWQKLQLAISEATISRKVRFSMLCVSKERRLELFKVQYPLLGGDLEASFKDNPQLRNLVEDFLPKAPTSKQVVTEAKFYDLILDEEEGIKKKFVQSGYVYESPSLLPFNMWIAGDTEAVFSFPTHTKTPEEGSGNYSARAFYTRDGNIVESLIQVFKRCVADATGTASSV